MSRNQSFLHSLLFALLVLGWIAPSAQAFTVVCGTEACSASNSNATGIEQLEYDGLFYDVTFVYDELGVVYGFPPEFDFESGGDAARDSVVAALMSVPEVTTVGAATLDEFHIQAAPPGGLGPWFTTSGEYSSGSWRDGASQQASPGSTFTWAKFEVTTGPCSVDADCDDGNFCTGNETCNGGQCQDGSLPCAQVCLEDVDQCAASAPPATVILDGSGTNATAIEYLPYDGLLYNVGFVGAAAGSDSVYGTPPEFDFPADETEAVIGAVNAELNATLAITVGPTSGFPLNMYRIGQSYDDTGEDVRFWGGEWFSNSSNWSESASGTTSLNSANDIWAVFTVVSGPAGCSADADCDDGDFCTGNETCNGGQCQDGPLPCAEGDLCYEDVDQCVAVQCTSDSDCDNGVFCDGMGTCDAGQCVAGTPPCVGDAVCYEEVDQCVVPACTVDADCANAFFCDGEETCVSGQCQQGTTPCEPGQVCVDETDECVYPECFVDADCDNGTFCDGLEVCDAGECQPGSLPCAEDEICSEGSTGAECVVPECNVDADCANDSFCDGEETCDGGLCQDGTPPCGAGEICDEDADQCDAVECINDDQCDDGLFCTGMETCSAGQCQAGTPPCAVGETCDDQADQCVEPGCTSDADCANDSFCDGEETCEAGQCQAGTPADCGDGICLGILDECVDPECINDVQCDDGFYCNGVETCVEGRCEDGGPECGPDQTCYEILGGTCLDTECSVDTDCDDGSFCNGEETCNTGQCQPVNTSPCAADETCDEGADACVEPQRDCREERLECVAEARLERRACTDSCSDELESALEDCDGLSQRSCKSAAKRAAATCGLSCTRATKTELRECRQEFQECRAER